MAPWDDGLVGVHRDIAANPAPALHVLAGPGTGKTFAMMRRIARLLEEGAPPAQILAVSFTRTAARDLSEQLQDLGVPGADAVRASTLHSLCFQVLNREEAFPFTNRVPRPLMSYEIGCLEEDLAGAFGGKRETRRLLAAYEAAWARLQRDEPGHAPTAEDQAFETALLSWLRFHSAMLIGELVPLTLSFLRANPALPVLPALAHVLVDEFQDLNKADQALARALAATSDLLVIGDDNQSIYSFRYANPEGVRTFPTDVPGTVPYTITACRRCPPNIVAMSNALISHDPHTSRPQPLTPDLSLVDAEIHIVQHATLDDEVAATADFIDKYLSDHPDLPAGRVLVLTPRRFIGNAIKTALIARRRNALSYFQENSLEEEAAAEGFCLLSLLVSPEDPTSIRAWLGFGSSDRRKRPYARLRRHCEANAMTVAVALDALAESAVAIPYTGPLIPRWTLLQERLAELGGLHGMPLVDALWPATQPELSDIRTIAGALALSDPANDELLDDLREAITQPELPGSDGDIIQIMSLHKSKGLTRSVVIVAGCMAGTLPSIDPADAPAIQEHQYDEQRRLFYVGITRATDVLVISASAKLPLRDALRSGATVIRKSFEGGVAMARTAFTPFLSELGAGAPQPIGGAAWRRAVGITSAVAE
jgi:DNA helicase-2/ATP-dependent DNA helicase PcrA